MNVLAGHMRARPVAAAKTKKEHIHAFAFFEVAEPVSGGGVFVSDGREDDESITRTNMYNMATSKPPPIIARRISLYDMGISFQSRALTNAS